MIDRELYVLHYECYTKLSSIYSGKIEEVDINKRREEIEKANADILNRMSHTSKKNRKRKRTEDD